jgi:hypothetical protein
LREKVSAKPTDEGFLGVAGATPHPTSLREATLSRKGRGTRRQVSAVKIRVTTAMSKKRVTAVSSMMGLEA